MKSRTCCLPRLQRAGTPLHQVAPPSVPKHLATAPSPALPSHSHISMHCPVLGRSSLTRFSSSVHASHSSTMPGDSNNKVTPPVLAAPGCACIHAKHRIYGAVAHQHHHLRVAPGRVPCHNLHQHAGATAFHLQGAGTTAGHAARSAPARPGQCSCGQAQPATQRLPRGSQAARLPLHESATTVDLLEQQHAQQICLEGSRGFWPRPQQAPPRENPSCM